MIEILANLIGAVSTTALTDLGLATDPPLIAGLGGWTLDIFPRWHGYSGGMGYCATLSYDTRGYISGRELMGLRDES